MIRPDDSILTPPQLATVRRHADRLLREASALDRFPTPIDDIMAAAKLTVVDDEVLNETITENLAFLGNWTKTSSFMVGEDSGVRKSFAEHIITHHYNNGGDISRSRALFSRYYGAPDSLEVWDGIRQHLGNIFGMDFAAEQYSKSIMELVGEIERLTKEDKE